MGESLNKLCHSDDPETSKAAIENFESSGARSRHLKIIEEAVRANPGFTACELMTHTGLEEYQIRRRLTDLKNDGKVRRGESKLCSVKGTKNVTWFSLSAEEQEAIKTELMGIEARVAALGFNALDEYYADAHWTGFREGYFARHARACAITGRTDNIQIHHITYQRLGAELDEDVIPLCREMHELLHKIVKEYKVPLDKAHLVLKEARSI